MLLDTVRDLAPYLDSWLAWNLRRSRIPGVQAAIRVGSDLAWSFADGHANASSGEPLRRDHLFHVASHSKTFTAVAVLRLVEAGRLRLDDAAGQWVPALEDSPAAHYTVRELLGHMSGINRDGSDSDYWQLRGDFPDDDGLLAFARQDAIYATNEHFKYSNVGYSILGMIIAAAAGRPYADVVLDEIVRPLGLVRTGPEVPQDRVGELAAGHGVRFCDADPVQVIPHVATHAMASATGFYSTAEELTAYLACLADGRTELLSDDSKRLMRHVEGRVTRGGERFYGLGLIMMDVGGRRLVGHSGGWPGHISQSWLDPVTGLAVSVLTNGLGSPASEWATNLVKLVDLAAACADDPYPYPVGFEPTEVVGRYRNLWGIEDIALFGGQLVSLSPAGDPSVISDRLRVADARTLTRDPEPGFSDVGEPTLIERDEAGQVIAIRSGGMTAWPQQAYDAMERPW